jgi:hypothetical protein
MPIWHDDHVERHETAKTEASLLTAVSSSSNSSNSGKAGAYLSERQGVNRVNNYEEGEVKE